MKHAPRVGVVTFPGSNGDRDALWAFQQVLAADASLIDYRTTRLPPVDALVLPGGFSYGDYLRCGAIARFAPVMTEIVDFVERGGPVLGICNGFQILTEAHLLPGALLRNQTLRFHAHWTSIKFEATSRSWAQPLATGPTLRLPVAHGDGAYTIDPGDLPVLEANGQIVARYCTSDGDVAAEANANGSIANIAGVSNRRGNVVGLMPHPERAVESLVGGSDGVHILRAFLSAIDAEVSVPSTS